MLELWNVEALQVKITRGCMNLSPLDARWLSTHGTEMSLFRTNVVAKNPKDETRATSAIEVRVDTGSELTWLPAELIRAVGIGALIVQTGALGCSTSDSSRGGSPDWVCCLPGDSGTAVPAGWCECATRKVGVSVDCFGRGTNACPATPHCVVERATDIWSCACSDDGTNLPAGSDVYPVEQCPP
jgi:hypothetical protein